MKPVFLSLATIILGSGLLQAGFSERRLESAIASATKSGKLIAFVFYKDYALPNCPKCVTNTDASNKAIKDVIPRSKVVMVEIDPGDKNLDKLPDSVKTTSGMPRVVITDSQGKSVIAKASGSPDREQAKEIKALVEKASAGS